MALDLERVQALLRLVNESGVAEVEVEEHGTRIVIRRTSATVTVQPAMPFQMAMMQPMGNMVPAQPSEADLPPASGSSPADAPAKPTETSPAANEVVVRAPIVGTFYRAASPDSDPFVKEGSQVGPEDTLCIIEAMKLMNEIKAETTGIVRQILVQNGEPVEYDQPLFVIEGG